jgi:preprotein translocase subunit SecF
MSTLQADNKDAELRRVEFVGPQVGKELAENGALALLVVSIGIVLYLALRFEWKFGLSAIIANLHDVVIILGFFALFSGNSRCRCSPPCLQCSATRSTNRWSCSTGCVRTSAR